MLQRATPLPYRMADAFWRHRLRFFIACVGVTGVVGAALVVRTKAYIATASTRVVKNEQVASVMGRDSGPNSWMNPSDLNVAHFNDLLLDVKPGGFVDNALQGAKLATPINVDPRANDKRFEQMLRGLAIRSDSKDVFSVALKWDRPDEAERIVKAFQDRFIEEAGLSRQAASIATAQFLNSQIENYRKRMQGAENVLIQYKQSHAGQLPDAQASEMQQLSQLVMQLDVLKVTSEDSRLVREAIERRLKEIKPTSLLEQTVVPKNSAALQALPQSALEQQVQALQGQKAALLARGYLATSRSVQEVDAEIRAREAGIAKEREEAARAVASSQGIVETKVQSNPEYNDLTSELVRAQIEERTQNAQIKLLQERIAQYEARIRALPAAERTLTEKTRDYTILKEQFESLLKRREDAQVKADLEKVEGSSTLVPVGVIYAQSTAGTKKMLIMLAGSLVLGVIVGAGVVVASEWLDGSVRYADDATRLLGLPLVECLPEAPGLLALPPSKRRLLGGRTAAEGTSAG